MYKVTVRFELTLLNERKAYANYVTTLDSIFGCTNFAGGYLLTPGIGKLISIEIVPAN